MIWYNPTAEPRTRLISRADRSLDRGFARVVRRLQIGPVLFQQVDGCRTRCDLTPLEQKTQERLYDEVVRPALQRLLRDRSVTFSKLLGVDISYDCLKHWRAEDLESLGEQDLGLYMTGGAMKFLK